MFRAEIRRATIKMRRLRLLFLDGPGTLVRDRHPARSTIAVGLVSHRATTSGGRKGERRSPISHLVDTFIQNALITPSSTPPAAPCVSPLSPPSLPTPPRRSGINEFEHDNANFCRAESSRGRRRLIGFSVEGWIYGTSRAIH